MEPLQLCEWERRTRSDWPREVREEMNTLARAWKEANALAGLPLEWIGDTLQARQFVGVVECGDYRVEVFPKLDKHLLAGGAVNQERQSSTLGHLLRLLEAAQFEQHVENGAALLGDEALSFPDIWALLLARGLERELRRGLPHAYISMGDDLPRVRGKIELKRQLTTHFGRADKLACVWDEFSSDNALNRLFRCALDVLARRVHHSGAKRALRRTLALLDDVALVSPREALSQAQHPVWTRTTRRFESHHAFAVRLLRGQSFDFGGRSSRSWVFLTDMNALFEAFCARALEARLNVRVSEQENVGFLFPPNGIKQIADFVWQHDGGWFIGDAKWKLLGAKAPLLEEEDAPPSPNALSPADVRQLTVYAELLRENKGLSTVPELWILYPTLDASGVPPAPRLTWNQAMFRRVPVSVCEWNSPGDALVLRNSSLS